MTVSVLLAVMSEQTKAGEEGLSLEIIEEQIYRKLQSLKGVRSKEDEWMSEYLRNHKNASTGFLMTSLSEIPVTSFLLPIVLEDLLGKRNDDR